MSLQRKKCNFTNKANKPTSLERINQFLNQEVQNKLNYILTGIASTALSLKQKKLAFDLSSIWRKSLETTESEINNNEWCTNVIFVCWGLLPCCFLDVVFFSYGTFVWWSYNSYAPLLICIFTFFLDLEFIPSPSLIHDTFLFFFLCINQILKSVSGGHVSFSLVFFKYTNDALIFFSLNELN